MGKLGAEDFEKVVKKLGEFMQYCQKVKSGEDYLIVDRNSPQLAEAAAKAAQNCGLNVRAFKLAAKEPYKHFPKDLQHCFRKRLRRLESDSLITASIQSGT